MQPNYLFQQAIGSYLIERWWVNIIKKIYEVFFFNYCFPMYKFFCYLLHVSNQLFSILVWKLFGDFRSTARHNYPLYLHNVKLIALTFHMQHQKPCDSLNWALPCEPTHQVGNRVQTFCSLQLAFVAPSWSTLTIYNGEEKRKHQPESC